MKWNSKRSKKNIKTNETNGAKGTIRLVFLLDRSGSMSGLESDTIGGFNSLIEKQKKEEGQCFVTTILFDNEVEMIHRNVPIMEVKPMTSKEYYVRGTTALLDAIGTGMSHMEKQRKLSGGNGENENVLFIITTDGYENASVEYSPEKVKEKIKDLKEAKGWKFLFLGANIDAITVAEDFGIEKSFASTYVPDAEGTSKNFSAMSNAITQMRCCSAIDESWKEEIKEYYGNIGKKQ